MRLAWLIAVRLLRRRGTALLRTSAVASLAAIALGVAALVVVLALMNGYRDALRRGILAGGGHLVALFPAPMSSADAERYERDLAGLPGVEAITRALYLPALVFPPDGGAAEAITVKATSELPAFIPAATAAGPLLGVWIGDGLARRLEVRAGAHVSLQMTPTGGMPTGVPAQVAGVFRTGFAEIDDRWALTRLDDLRARTSGIDASTLELWLEDPEGADRLVPAVERASAGKALVTTWQENNRNLFAALRWQKISLGVVLSLVLGVGAFEIASSLVVLVTEKRRELGILLALGAEPVLIRRTLLIAGGLMGAVGVLSGVLLGAALAVLLTVLGVPRFPPEIAEIYMVERIPLRLAVSDLLVVTTLGLGEVALASLLPARRAAARDPVEVLRWV